VTLQRPPAAYRLPAETTFGPRVLDSFEFVWVLAGSAEVALDDFRHVLRPGVLQLSRPGMTDYYTWRGRRPAHAFVHFQLVDRGRLPEPDGWPLVRPIPSSGAITGLLADLVRLHADRHREEADIVTSLLLDRFVLGRADDSVSLFAGDPFVAALIRALKRTWARTMGPFSVADLADELSLSRSQTTRLTVRTFGVPPRELIELLRLFKAATMLRRTNSAVKAIATACGFADQFHFAKRFRHVYGTTPTLYRGGVGTSPDEPLAQRSVVLSDLAQQLALTP